MVIKDKNFFKIKVEVYIKFLKCDFCINGWKIDCVYNVSKCCLLF